MLTTIPLSAQTISGTILDDEGNPLAGATIYWDGTTIGTTASEDGEYTLHKVKNYNKLITTYIGLTSDTVEITPNQQEYNITLGQNSLQLQDVEIHSRIGGNYISSNTVNKQETISFAGLCKMACCNLAESFENSAAVTVGYSDAISGARQIKMLGLAGTYTQMLDENRTIMRGLSAPYALSYTPGMWLNSIQVSKGISSITAGHEAITGQINMEYRKPTDEERLFLNLFLNSELKPEINISSAFPVSKNKKLSTVILAHASTSTNVVGMDDNGDGYRDMPSTQFYTVANRWSYLADNGLQLRWGAKFLQDKRLGGDVDYDDSMRNDMLALNIYGSQIENQGVNGYFKIGMPIGRAVYDAESESELRSNIAMIVDVDYFKEDGYFGLNNYNGTDLAVMFNAMYNHYFTPTSSLIVGVSGNYQTVTEQLANNTPWLSSSLNYNLNRNDNEVGIYGEYTYKYGEKFSLIAGIRGDYNQYYNNYFATPRGQIKWSITPTTTLRGSGGIGYKTTNVITDNIGILATGREIVFDNGTSSAFNRQEQAYTVGGSLTQQFKILKPRDATISFDYFRTQFMHQVIVDQEMSSTAIHIYDSNEESYTNTIQVDFTWKPIENFDIFATYRYTDSKITLNRTDGTTYKVDRPLVSQYKALLNLQYATNMRRWVFDVTAQLNGKSRLPVQNGDITTSEYSPAYPMFFAQVSTRIKHWELYAGCENIANYTQDTPIISADNPFSTDFNSSVVWGPLSGRKFYIGTRFNLY